MLKLFRWVALFEGVTMLALFLIAMPLKYVFGNPALVPPVGMIHGVAFLGYLAVMVIVLPFNRFSIPGWIRTTLAAFVPFGTFLNDAYIRGHERRRPDA